MSRQVRRATCRQCRRPLPTCYCAHVRRIDNDWPVLILQHPREARHAIGTARIAALSLARCTLKSPEEAHADPACFAIPDESLLIYPGAEVRPISELMDSAPRPLLFLDASWRKSRRMLHEHPRLASLPRYQLMNSPPSRYRIRREPDARSLSTLEAICATLATLERSESKYLPMLKVMDWMIEQQIQHMGQKRYRRNYRNEGDTTPHSRQ